MPVERAACMFSGIQGIDGTAWYHPQRLSIDSDAVNGGVANPAQGVLGVRATHGTELALPIYALETSFGAGRVLNGARLLAEQSGIPEEDLMLVDESDRLAHTDPMAVDTAEKPAGRDTRPVPARPQLTCAKFCRSQLLLGLSGRT